MHLLASLRPLFVTIFLCGTVTSEQLTSTGYTTSERVAKLTVYPICAPGRLIYSNIDGSRSVYLNDLKRTPLLKDMRPEIKVVKEKICPTIEKDHRRFYAAASQTGPYMAHIGGEHATLAIPAHVEAKLANREARFWADREFTSKLVESQLTILSP